MSSFQARPSPFNTRGTGRRGRPGRERIQRPLPLDMGCIAPNRAGRWIAALDRPHPRAKPDRHFLWLGGLRFMANVAVVGSQWGDEGKGKIVDWLRERDDVVVRFQGGHNAGHTLVI